MCFYLILHNIPTIIGAVISCKNPVNSVIHKVFALDPSEFGVEKHGDNKALSHVPRPVNTRSDTIQKMYHNY